MNPRCTCGAVLPDDARFCHKCGKPQYDEDIARLSAHEPVSAPAIGSVGAVPAAQNGVSFRNSRAVWITFAVAAVTLVAMILLALLFFPLFPIVLCAAGFVATRLYNQNATQPLTAAAAARLGWMTGFWVFLAVAVTSSIVAVALSDPAIWNQFKSTWSQFPQMAQVAINSPHEFLVKLLMNLPVTFLVFTLLPGLGGILGAKFPRRRSS